MAGFYTKDGRWVDVPDDFSEDDIETAKQKAEEYLLSQENKKEEEAGEDTSSYRQWENRTVDALVPDDIQRDMEGLHANIEYQLRTIPEKFKETFYDEDVSVAKKETAQEINERLRNLYGREKDYTYFKNLEDSKKVELKDTETITGTVAHFVPYLLGGVAGIGAKTVLGGAARVLAAETAITQAYDDPDANLANLAEDLGFENTLTEFLAADETDSQLEKRIKLLGEGVALTAIIEAIPVGSRILQQVKAKFKGEDLTDEEFNGELFLEVLKEKKARIDKNSTEYLEAQRDLALKKGDEGTEEFEEAVSTETGEQVLKQATKVEGESQIGGMLWRGLRRFFTTRGYQTKNQFNAFEGSQHAQRQAVAHAEDIVGQLEKSIINMVGYDSRKTEKIMQKVQQALGNDLDFGKAVSQEDKIELLTNLFDVSEDVATSILDARNLIDSLSEEIIQKGIAKDDAAATINEQIGQYLKRSYRLFEDPNYTPTDKVRNDAIKHIEGQLIEKHPDWEPELITQKAIQQVNNILKGDKSSYANYFIATSKVNDNILKRKKDIDEPIRKLMGEIENPSDNIILTVSRMTNLIESSKYFKTLARLGKEGGYILDDTVKRDPNIEWVEITGTNSKYLDGKYTTKEMLTTIKNQEARFSFATENDWYRNFLALKGWTQKQKTVNSHVTQVRNVVGGAQFGPANGMNPFGKDALEALRVTAGKVAKSSSKESEELYRDYIKKGIINTNTSIGEFRDLLEISLDSKFSAKGFQKHLDDFDKALPRGQERLYQEVDNFYKIVAYNYELDFLKKAMPDEPLEILETMAARKVKDTFPNYDRVPKGIKALKQLPLGSFVSFPAEIIRTSFKIIETGMKEINSGNAMMRQRGMQRLAGYAGTSAAWQTAAYTSGAMLGFNGEEQDAVSKLTETPWSKHSPKFMFRDDKGEINTIDTQFLNSYSFIQEPFIRAYGYMTSGKWSQQEIDSWMFDTAVGVTEDLLRPFIDEAILTDAITNIAYAGASRLSGGDGRDRQGRKVFTEGMTGAEMADELFTTIVKTLAPGSAISLQRLWEADKGIVNPSTGIAPDWENELRTQWSGVKAKKLNPESTLRYKVADYNRDVTNVASLDIDYERGRLDILSRYKEKQKALYEKQKALYDQVQAYVTLYGQSSAYYALRDSGMSKSSANAILLGRFKPTKISNSTIDRVYDRSPISLREKRTTVVDLENLYDDYETIRLNEPREKVTFEQEENVRIPWKVGGEVDIPNAPSEPDERIDKYTGRPYNEQAGEAYIDVEERINKKKGGKMTARGIKYCA